MSKERRKFFPEEPGYEEGMVPFPRAKLVLKTESTGIESVHIRFGEEAKQIFVAAASRHPQIGWFKEILQSPSHRYPENEQERKDAFELGNSYIGVSSRLSDLEWIAQDALLLSAGISLLGGNIIDEHIVGAFGAFKAQRTVTFSNHHFLAASTKEVMSAANSLLKIFNGSGIPEKHHIPETTTEKNNALALRMMFEDLMKSTPSHDARNFILASAARVLELGGFTNPEFLKIHKMYKDVLNGQRNGRMYSESDRSRPENYDDENPDNLSPWGTITW